MHAKTICAAKPTPLILLRQFAWLTHKMWFTQSRSGELRSQQQYMGPRAHLTDRCRPATAGRVPHMFIWPTGHDGTARWLICHNSSRVVLADRLHGQVDQLQRARLTHAIRSPLPRRVMWFNKPTHKTAHTAMMDHRHDETPFDDATNQHA